MGRGFTRVALGMCVLCARQEGHQHDRQAGKEALGLPGGQSGTTTWQHFHERWHRRRARRKGHAGSLVEVGACCLHGSECRANGFCAMGATGQGCRWGKGQKGEHPRLRPRGVVYVHIGKIGCKRRGVSSLGGRVSIRQGKKAWPHGRLRGARGRMAGCFFVGAGRLGRAEQTGALHQPH